MKRSVFITPRARLQIGSSALWWAQNRSSIQAAQWLAQLELRQMLFGLSGKRTHRVLFAIHDHRIVVYAVRHLAQRDIDRMDIA